jgi:hypothetical protein
VQLVFIPDKWFMPAVIAQSDAQRLTVVMT